MTTSLINDNVTLFFLITISIVLVTETQQLNLLGSTGDNVKSLLSPIGESVGGTLKDVGAAAAGLPRLGSPRSPPRRPTPRKIDNRPLADVKFKMSMNAEMGDMDKEMQNELALPTGELDQGSKMPSLASSMNMDALKMGSDEDGFDSMKSIMPPRKSLPPRSSEPIAELPMESPTPPKVASPSPYIESKPESTETPDESQDQSGTTESSSTKKASLVTVKPPPWQGYSVLESHRFESGDDSSNPCSDPKCTDHCNNILESADKLLNYIRVKCSQDVRPTVEKATKTDFEKYSIEKVFEPIIGKCLQQEPANWRTQVIFEWVDTF